MQVWNVLHAARWKHRTQDIAKNSPSAHHRTTLSVCIFATKVTIDNRKKFVKQQYLLHMFSQYGELGPLAAEISSGVWGIPANFNGFRVLAPLLHRRRSREVSQSLHDVWPSSGLVHCIYFFRGLLPLTEIYQVKKFNLHPSLAFSYICSVTGRHSSSWHQPNFAAFSRGHQSVTYR